MLGTMAVQRSTIEGATHKRLYSRNTRAASQERFNLITVGMGANPTLWTLAGERRLHGNMIRGQHADSKRDPTSATLDAQSMARLDQRYSTATSC